MAGMGGNRKSSAAMGAAGTAEADLRGAVVVIPAWRPDHRLPALLRVLRAGGVTSIVVVDDGSGPAFAHIFAELAAMPGVELCRHEQNLGKGRALKTAFAHMLASVPEARAAVTADADGQHLPEDILRVAQAVLREPDHAVLGVRRFGPGVPWRSRLGNQLTRQLFALVGGRLLQDTQTGLRGLPCALLSGLLQLPGERYEYEMVMLAHLCGLALPLWELPIATVYLDGNRGSHFHPLRDSFLVYRALLRFRGAAATAVAPRAKTPATAKEPGLHAI